MAAYSLIRIYTITSEQIFNDKAQTIFITFADSMQRSPSAYTFALTALDFFLGPSLKISCEGRLNDQSLVQMKQLVYKHFIPNKVLTYRFSDATAKGYVCKNNTCHAPTEDLAVLERQLLE